MLDQFPNDSDSTQRRIRQNRIVIHTDFGTISMGKLHNTEITASGDVISDDAEHLIMVDGEVITDENRIVGQCQNPECSTFLTTRTFRFCHFCSRVRCPICAAYDSELQLWLCADCSRAVRRARFWASVRRILSRPFRRG